MNGKAVKLDVTSRALHIGLALFGVAAWWTGEDANDYARPEHSGYDIHLWLGIGMAVFVMLRLGWGLAGPAPARFSNWVPWNAARFKLVMDDLKGFLKLRLPERETHEGIAGLVQALGLLLFTWLSASGVVIAIMVQPGERLTGWAHALKETHEATGELIPAYLILHVGAVVLHAFRGRQIWKKMIFLGK
jgi:cytochrome b